MLVSSSTSSAFPLLLQRRIEADPPTTVDSYRNKTRTAVEALQQDIRNVAPHYETRVGKRQWNERMRHRNSRDDDA